MGSCSGANSNSIATDEIGGFIIAYGDTTTSKLVMHSVNKDLTTLRSEKKTELGAGYFPSIDIFRNLVFIFYFSASGYTTAGNNQHLILNRDTLTTTGEFAAIYTTLP